MKYFFFKKRKWQQRTPHFHDFLRSTSLPCVYIFMCVSKKHYFQRNSRLIYLWNTHLLQLERQCGSVELIHFDLIELNSNLKNLTK